MWWFSCCYVFSWNAGRTTCVDGAGVGAILYSEYIAVSIFDAPGRLSMLQ
jgi:hypothetical protein